MRNEILSWIHSTGLFSAKGYTAYPSGSSLYRNWFFDRNLPLRELCAKYYYEQDKNRKMDVLSSIRDILESGLHVNQINNSDNVINTLSKQPFAYVDRILLAEVYLSNDVQLIELFQKYAPTPRVSFFGELPIAETLRSHAEEEMSCLSKFFDKHEKTPYYELENKIKVVQRQFRKQRRYREESSRISSLWGLENNFKTRLKINYEQAVYRPEKCNKELADRLVRLSSQLDFFKTAVHRTSEGSLKSIFDDGLMGRESMQSLLMSFNEAALANSDVIMGDFNVACCFASYGEVDSHATGDIEFTFQIEPLKQKNKTTPLPLFFKQKDFGFYPQRYHNVPNIGWNPVALWDFSDFMLTSSGYTFRNATPDLVFDFGYNSVKTYLKNKYITNKDVKNSYKYQPFRMEQYSFGFFKTAEYCAVIPSHMLISYDIRNIEQVLALNFFRYIDNIEFSSNKDCYFSSFHTEDTPEKVIKDFYAAIERMSDEKLLSFLEKIAKRSSHSMEFNIYGCLQIAEYLESIYSRKTKFRLSTSNLIGELNQGQFELLEKGLIEFHGLFESYRFVEHLISKVDNVDALQRLSAIRNKCEAPWHMKYTKDLANRYNVLPLFKEKKLRSSVPRDQVIEPNRKKSFRN